MKNRLKVLVLTGILAVFLVGCGGVGSKINRLAIDMHKDEVRSLFGNSFQAKASKVDANGNVLDLWEYYDEKSKTTYQIFFLNDRVSQWGRKEDLKGFPELHAPTPR